VIELQPELIAGGPGATWGITNQFAKSAYEATFKARSAAEAAKIVIPILMFRSGDDRIVGAKGFDALRDNAINAPHFEEVNFPDAYHESYMERDAIRDVVVSKTKEFLETF
jgi:alpha-beta hydrolase superfamily lysophospholipase